MAQELVETPQAKSSDVTETEKLKEKKDRNRPPTKIVIRRLPPSMTEETFREQVSPLPDHDYLYFVRADLSLGPAAFSRAYINFIKQDDIFLFKDQYDGYIFVDKTGGEYSAVVEFAPFQRLPKKRALRRKDIRAGTIEEDPLYISFLQSIEDEIKDKENEHTFDYSYKPPENEDKKVTTTPLLEFLKQRRAERQRSRDERKEDRRKKERDRELEKRKIREDEKKRRRADIKEKEKESPVVKQVLRSTNNEKDIAAKDRDGKGKVEKKLEDERLPFKDKVRDKAALKTNHSTRQRAGDSRGQRKEERRSVEDLRKKPQTQSSDQAQDSYAHSRRSNAAGDSRKPANRYRDKEPTQGSSRNRDREQRKTGREYEPRKGGKEESKNVVTKEKLPSDGAVKPERDILPANAVVKTRRASVDNTVKCTVQRRFSLDGDYTSTDNLSDLKPFCKSADNIQKQKPYVPKFSGDKPERSAQQRATKSSKEGKELHRAHKGRPAMERRTVERDKGRPGVEKRTSSAAVTKEADKARRSSLESGDKATKVSMRRNHSLEMDTEPQRSRETSVVSSSGDGEDRKQSENGSAKKDPRPERRIRNKDRPSIEIYRPGMGRFSKQRIDRDKD